MAEYRRPFLLVVMDGLWISPEILGMNISTGQQFILAYICQGASLEQGEFTQTNSDIASALGMSPHGVSESISLLQKNGHLKSEVDPGLGNRRIIYPLFSLLSKYLYRVADDIFFSQLHPSDSYTRSKLQTKVYKSANFRRRKSERTQLKKKKLRNCIGCGYTKNLVSHHLKPISLGGSAKDGVVTLCENCHKAIHTVNGKFSWSHVNPVITRLYSNQL